MTYWHQREITNRLQADRQRRHINDCNGIDALLDRLPPHIVFAIATALDGDELITQYRADECWPD